MKKTIIKSAFVAAFIAVAGYAAYHSQHDMELSELAMENVEALASGEGTGSKTCYNTITTMEGSQVLYCQTCSWVPGTPSWISGKGKC